MRIKLTREVALPSPVRLARFRASPQLGPKTLFFSGGTALRGLCRELISYTHNSVHLITPFDSGGSSAKLREAFRMPAVGDVRNRLMALADVHIHGYPQILELFAYRFPKKAEARDLAEELGLMARGRHRLVARVPDPMRKIIRNHLHFFAGHAPADFDLQGASIGNLVLTGGYLFNRRHLDPVIYIFSKLVDVRGVVRPVVNEDMHLKAELADGRVVVGQHLLTGKEAPPLESRISRLCLVKSYQDPREAKPPLRAKIREMIASAEQICYPFGSFFTSLLANLLPSGVGRAVAANPCPKIYVPSTGLDPECAGMALADQVRVLVEALRADDPEGIRARDVLQFVIVDNKKGTYAGGVDEPALERLGVRPVIAPLVSARSKPYIDPELLLPLLMSLI